MITPQSMIHELDLVSTSIVGLQSDLQRLIDTKGDSFENLPKGSVSYMCDRIVNWETLLSDLRLTLVSDYAEMQARKEEE